jgi:hypothetical protein
MRRDASAGRPAPARSRATDVAASDSVPAMIQKPRCGPGERADAEEDRQPPPHRRLRARIATGRDAQVADRQRRGEDRQADTAGAVGELTASSGCAPMTSKADAEAGATTATDSDR